MHRRMLATIFVAACGGASTPPAAEPTNTGGEATAADSRPVVTFVRVELGDAACYVYVTDESGAEQSQPGVFDLCNEGAIPAVGAKVRLRTSRESMLAPSCEGNPDCPDREEVDVVSGFDAAE
jgi:hypothetical protein